MPACNGADNPHSVNRITGRCKTLPCPKLRLQAVKIVVKKESVTRRMRHGIPPRYTYRFIARNGIFCTLL